MIDWQKIRSEFEQEDITLKALAEKYGLSPSTVRSRKNRDSWQRNDGENVATRRNATDQPGGQNNNQNAKGNSGNPRAAPPPGNKNAVSTGEHETIFADTLTKEEKDLYSELSEDPFLVMSEEVRLLKIRQLRMMKRIQAAEDGLSESEMEYLQELRGRTKVLESTRKQKNNLELIVTEIKEHKIRKIDDILRIEDALTRVSAQLQKAIKQLEELAINRKRLALMEAQTDHTKAQTTKALINKDGDEQDGGTVINIIDDIG
ncbi:small subunit of terminase [Enterococcus hulanensis]|uniref:phage terminase small subunit n=1 Tax=Enterococcus TaxID=1350 RepID=UPI000B5A417A|nr:phage terminase small subunit [Enterococcus sp. 3H8_DIV0648]MBO0413211.1 small subunit of terminase [Enterococcus hulanensis]OTO15122.1 hypothetical protein A5875_004279 [Enterococcus sp. 3H8_DIV0648]